MDQYQRGKNFILGWKNVLDHYKTGGKVKKTGLAVVHKNEYVLPVSVKPTKAQKTKVMKLKKKC